MEQDSQATEGIQEMECEKEVHLSGSSSQSELKYDSMSELAGDAEDLEMSEKRDVLEEMPTDLWDKVREQKKNEPSMFVSGWEEDDQEMMPEDPSEQQKFLLAAENGDVNTLKQMFERNPSLLMTRDRDGYTPLHRSAYNNHVDACKWLLSVGADPELRTETGWTALHSAACWASHNVVGILLSHGANVNSHSNGDVTPLHLAINNSTANLQDQLITIKYLLSAPGIDMSALNKAGETPLALARRASPAVLDLVEHFLNRP